MALYDTLVTRLDAQLDEEAAKEPEVSWGFSMRPVDSSDWSAGYTVTITTSNGFAWTSDVLPATERPNTNDVLAELQKVVDEIQTRRKARRG